jgi:hypothetical protein
VKIQLAFIIFILLAVVAIYKRSSAIRASRIITRQDIVCEWPEISRILTFGATLGVLLMLCMLPLFIKSAVALSIKDQIALVLMVISFPYLGCTIFARSVVLRADGRLECITSLGALIQPEVATPVMISRPLRFNDLVLIKCGPISVCLSSDFPNRALLIDRLQHKA